MLAIGGDAAPAGSGGDDGACGSPYEPVPPPSRAPPLELVLSFDIALRSDDDTGAPRLGGATEVAPAAIAAPAERVGAVSRSRATFKVIGRAALARRVVSGDLTAS